MAALYRNSWFDRIVNSVTLTTIAMPEFYFAYIWFTFSQLN
jgi:peptide/nickel transport system permease protein